MQHQSSIKLGQPTDDFHKVQDMEIDAQNNNAQKNVIVTKKNWGWTRVDGAVVTVQNQQVEANSVRSMTQHMNMRVEMENQKHLNSHDVILTFFMVLNTAVITTLTGWMTVKQIAQRVCSGESKRHVTSQTNKDGRYALVTSAEFIESAGAGVGKIYNLPHNTGNHSETCFKPCFQNPQFSLLFHLNIISLQAPKRHKHVGEGSCKKKKRKKKKVT